LHTRARLPRRGHVSSRLAGRPGVRAHASTAHAMCTRPTDRRSRPMHGRRRPMYARARPRCACVRARMHAAGRCWGRRPRRWHMCAWPPDRARAGAALPARAAGAERACAEPAGPQAGGLRMGDVPARGGSVGETSGRGLAEVWRRSGRGLAEVWQRSGGGLAEVAGRQKNVGPTLGGRRTNVARTLGKRQKTSGPTLGGRWANVERRWPTLGRSAVCRQVRGGPVRRRWAALRGQCLMGLPAAARCTSANVSQSGSCLQVGRLVSVGFARWSRAASLGGRLLLPLPSVHAGGRRGPQGGRGCRAGRPPYRPGPTRILPRGESVRVGQMVNGEIFGLAPKHPEGPYVFRRAGGAAQARHSGARARAFRPISFTYQKRIVKTYMDGTGSIPGGAGAKKKRDWHQAGTLDRSRTCPLRLACGTRAKVQTSSQRGGAFSSACGKGTGRDGSWSRNPEACLWPTPDRGEAGLGKIWLRGEEPGGVAWHARGRTDGRPRTQTAGTRRPTLHGGGGP